MERRGNDVETAGNNHRSSEGSAEQQRENVRWNGGGMSLK